MRQRKKPSAEIQMVDSILSWIGRLISSPFRKIYHNAKPSEIDRQKFIAKWQEVEALRDTPTPSKLKNAVIECDKLLDLFLKSKGLSGKTMGDRLKRARHLFARKVNYEKAWQAHKRRNQIVHDYDSELLHFQLVSAIDDFEEVFKDLGII